VKYSDIFLDKLVNVKPYWKSWNKVDSGCIVVESLMYRCVSFDVSSYLLYNCRPIYYLPFFAHLLSVAIHIHVHVPTLQVQSKKNMQWWIWSSCFVLFCRLWIIRLCSEMDLLEFYQWIFIFGIYQSAVCFDFDLLGFYQWIFLGFYQWILLLQAARIVLSHWDQEME
jgi:hypothetical protein